MSDEDDDYIPFEGPLRNGPSIRKVSKEEAESLRKTLKAMKEKRKQRAALAQS